MIKFADVDAGGLLHLFFWAVKLPMDRGFMATSLPETSAFISIREALNRLLSVSVKSQMS